MNIFLPLGSLWELHWINYCLKSLLFLTYLHHFSFPLYLLCCCAVLSHAWLHETFGTVAHQTPPMGYPGNTHVGSHSLLQGIFLTQGSNPGLLHCRQILYQLRHQRNPFMFLVLNIPSFFLPHYLSVFIQWVEPKWRSWHLDSGMPWCTACFLPLIFWKSSVSHFTRILWG